MQLYKEAIEDCELCLQLDPENIKARLRLAEATRAWGKKKEVRYNIKNFTILYSKIIFCLLVL